MYRSSRGGLVGAVAILAMSAWTTSADAEEISAIGAASVVEMRTPGSDGALHRYARGGALTISYLCGCDDISFGGEVTALFLGDTDTERRVYDLGLSFVMSYDIKGKRAVPFLALGLDLAGVTDPAMDPERRRSITTGIHARTGIHGFLDRKLYWRAHVGFLGAGPGGVTGGLSVGYSFNGR